MTFSRCGLEVLILRIRNHCAERRHLSAVMVAFKESAAPRAGRVEEKVKMSSVLTLGKYKYQAGWRQYNASISVDAKK